MGKFGGRSWSEKLERDNWSGWKNWEGEIEAGKSDQENWIGNARMAKSE